MATAKETSTYGGAAGKAGTTNSDQGVFDTRQHLIDEYNATDAELAALQSQLNANLPPAPDGSVFPDTTTRNAAAQHQQNILNDRRQLLQAIAVLDGQNLTDPKNKTLANASPDNQYVVTQDPSGNLTLTKNPNYQDPGNTPQAIVAQAQIALDQAALAHKTAYENGQLTLDQYKAAIDADVSKAQVATQQQLAGIAQQNADVNKQNADTSAASEAAGAQTGQENADTNRQNANTAAASADAAARNEAARLALSAPLGVTSAGASIGDAAVRGNLIPSMLPYMVPKGGLDNLHRAQASLGSGGYAPVTYTAPATAPGPPWDPMKVGGDAAAYAIDKIASASKQAFGGSNPAYNFQAPGAAPSLAPATPPSSVQPAAVRATPAAPPAAAQPAVQPAAARATPAAPAATSAAPTVSAPSAPLGLDPVSAVAQAMAAIGEARTQAGTSYAPNVAPPILPPYLQTAPPSRVPTNPLGNR